MSADQRVLVDAPAVRIVLDAVGVVSMFVVLGAVAGARYAAVVTTVLSAVVVIPRLRSRLDASRTRTATRAVRLPEST